MSILYGSSFNYPEIEFKKNPDQFMDPNHSFNHNNNPSLARYCSAPTSFFESLVTCSNANANAGVVNLDDLCYDHQTEIDTFYPISHQFADTSIKQEEAESSSPRQNAGCSNQMIYEQSQGPLEGSFGGTRSIPMESTLDGSSLARQKSSPAVFFSNLGIDNDVGNFTVTACNGTDGRTGLSTSQFNTHLNNFRHNSWDEASLRGLKRAREDDVNMFSNPVSLEIQNGNSRHCSNRLTHHLSLTKNSPELATTEKFLHFQNSNIPCKLRAKRGFATHPRSIAERERRTRISERMRKLQDLFPNIDKQATTAEMLDMAVEFIKELQNKVEALTDAKARCLCGSKQKQ
jgi:hypothetical protein